MKNNKINIDKKILEEDQIITLGIIGAGEVGAQIARAAVANGYKVVIANSRGPETLDSLTRELGPNARAARAVEAADAGDIVIIAVRLKLENNMPTEQLAGKIVIDTNNYMPLRDGHFSMIDSGILTVHELRQQQLPKSKVANAFNHIQAPTLFELSRRAGSTDRIALTVSSDYPEAAAFVTKLYDQFGYDTVYNGPLRESWRSGPGTPVWQQSLAGGQGYRALLQNLAAATRPSYRGN